MSTHELKTDPEVFQALIDGAKTYEIRRDDRGFAVGDTLVLRETFNTGEEMAAGAGLDYTGRQATREVTHILRGPQYGLIDDWVILSVNNQERDALAAHVELLSREGDILAQGLHPSDRDEWDGLKADASETSIARLKAEWQAAVLEEMAQRLRDDPAGHPLFKVEYWANKYRRQATGGE